MLRALLTCHNPVHIQEGLLPASRRSHVASSISFYYFIYLFLISILFYFYVFAESLWVSLPNGIRLTKSKV